MKTVRFNKAQYLGVLPDTEPNVASSAAAVTRAAKPRKVKFPRRARPEGRVNHNPYAPIRRADDLTQQAPRLASSVVEGRQSGPQPAPGGAEDNGL